MHPDDQNLFEFEPPPPAGDDVERPEPGESDPELMERVLAALKTVRDPEIPVNLVDLGLIYELIVNRDHDEDVYVALRDAFASLTRRLEDVARRQRGQVKAHGPTG